MISTNPRPPIAIITHAAELRLLISAVGAFEMLLEHGPPKPAQIARYRAQHNAETWNRLREDLAAALNTLPTAERTGAGNRQI